MKLRLTWIAPVLAAGLSACSVLGGVAAPSKVPSEGFTSPVAKARAGTIVFSKQPVDRAPKDESAFETKFALSDAIHLRPFFKDSFYNLAVDEGVACKPTSPHPAERFSLRVQVNDEADKTKWAWVDSIVPSEQGMKEWTTYSPDGAAETSLTVQDASKMDSRSPAYKFATAVLPLLKVGENKITVHAFGECRGKGSGGWENLDALIASGTFSLTVADGEVAAYLEASGPRLAASKHPENAQLIPLYKETIEREWDNEIFIGAVTTSEKWHVSRDKINGQPVSRSVDVSAVLQVKGKKGCRVFDLQFSQQYAGTGDPGNSESYHSRMQIGVGGNKPFPCANAPTAAAKAPAPAAETDAAGDKVSAEKED